MASQVSIANRALMHIGHKRFVSALTDQTLEAEVILQLWEDCLRSALQEIDWGFARERVTLEIGTPTPPAEWIYAYLRPPDEEIVALRRIADGLKVRRADDRPTFTVEQFAGTRYIYSDTEDAEMLCTRYETKTALFTPLFAQFLAGEIAINAAMPLTGSTQQLGAALQIRDYYRQRAVALEFESEEIGPAPESEFLAART